MSETFFLFIAKIIIVLVTPFTVDKFLILYYENMKNKCFNIFKKTYYVSSLLFLFLFTLYFFIFNPIPFSHSQTLNTIIHIIISYIITISILGYLFIKVDKELAYTKKGCRIPEAILHYIDLLGGLFGSYLAKEKYRHKTKKISYKKKNAFFGSLGIILLISFLYFVYIAKQEKIHQESSDFYTKELKEKENQKNSFLVILQNLKQKQKIQINFLNEKQEEQGWFRNWFFDTDIVDNLEERIKTYDIHIISKQESIKQLQGEIDNLKKELK